MSNPHWSPQPNNPITYRQADDLHPLMVIVRILAVALIVAAACRLLRYLGSSAGGRLEVLLIMVRQWPRVGLLPIPWQAMLGLVAMAVDIVLLIAAVACMSRSNAGRQIAIIFCWLDVGLTLVDTGMNVTNVLMRSRLPVTLYWSYLPQVMAGAALSTLLPIVAALILCQPSVVKTFVAAR